MYVGPVIRGGFFDSGSSTRISHDAKSPGKLFSTTQLFLGYRATSSVASASESCSYKNISSVFARDSASWTFFTSSSVNCVAACGRGYREPQRLQQLGRHTDSRYGYDGVFRRYGTDAASYRLYGVQVQRIADTLHDAYWRQANEGKHSQKKPDGVFTIQALSLP
ncbi:Uncharacterised protein [Klebsiella quasipneumoniae]|nr:Uncharacterised protein [Klebsiella quasipneumoniae]